MPSFINILWQTIKKIYQNIGTICLLSIIWTLSILPVITIIPATAGVYYITNKIAHNKQVNIHDFRAGIRKYWKKTFKLTLINISVLGILIFNILLAGNISDISFALIIAAVLWIYILIFWCFMMVYSFALTFEQDITILETLKRSAMLIIDNIVFNLGLGLWLLFITFLSILTPPILLFFFMGTIALTSNNVLLALLEKYKKLAKQDQ